MKCPKCGHEQSADIECESCGIIFEKFRKLQEKQLKLEQQRVTLESDLVSSGLQLPPRFFSFVAIAVVFIICAIGFRLTFKTSKSRNQDPSTIATGTIGVEPASIHEAEQTGISKQLNDYKNPHNKIEKSQLATVFIETPWGLGSGFFIDSDCRIITNRHVVDFDPEKIKELEYQVELLDKMIERDESAVIKAEKLLEQISDPNLRADMNHRLGIARQKIAGMKEQYHTLKKKLDQVKFGPASTVYEIYLYDESKYTVYQAEVSQLYDLALLRLDQENCPCLESRSTESLPVGLKVFTIGNPMGLSHTVTSGIISGERMHENIRYIQTDAPINPGNSGGPLIDEDGYVLGINTMVLDRAKGIGFALPIETALEEFGIKP
ncbi:MAG: trypsin-like serine protease [Desulfobacteraceae bacterium]|nr:trypsin-like serine protease [Desulfobacteraceae bacterium]